jgi:ribosomal protein S18 acetylase RimI-like enzyme
MVVIVKATEDHTGLLSELSNLTFVESHGHSAAAEDINNFIAEKYNPAILKKELQDMKNIFHILYYNNKVAGFSKIILNFPHTNCNIDNVAKLERIYLLKEFYNLHLGQQLLDFNINLIKENNQAGVWLFVWQENERAINFYIKNGFVVIGSFEYKISENHSNPNYQMLLVFK